MAHRLLILLSTYFLGWFTFVQSRSQSPMATGMSRTFTLSEDSDVGQPVIANVKDPEAIDAQSVCPGYKFSGYQETENGFIGDLTLAGPACNLYGTDIDSLELHVEYQAVDRLHVEILPKYIGQENYTWFILPEELIPKPHVDTSGIGDRNDLKFFFGNDPTFSFNVTRKSTGDVLFNTEGTNLVYADQFIEFSSSLPEDYNLYGLGEVIHGFRLSNNLTRTFYTADVGDIIDSNIYGVHPIYYDTRYFEIDEHSGKTSYAANATNKLAKYKSYTHGVFNRNVHGQEVVLKESNITWRALGGTVDLYFYAGPSQDAVLKSYQKSAIGLPAMQQLWTFGFHQCRWGYKDWTELQFVVDMFKEAEIPLETVWSDIDYMNQKRDFENDPVNYGYEEGEEFLSRLHENNQHYIPIIDSAIYIPDPENPIDGYPTFHRGLEDNAFMVNPDGSIYVGAVWPGYTVFPDWIGAVFNGTGTNHWWTTEVSSYWQKIKFDGIWIDMSEVASFCVGSCGSENRTQKAGPAPVELSGELGNEVVMQPEGFDVTSAKKDSYFSTLLSRVFRASTIDSRISALESRNSARMSRIAEGRASIAEPKAQFSALRSGISDLSSNTFAASSLAIDVSPTSFLRTKPTRGVRNINWPPYTLNNHNGDLAVHAVSPNATHHGGYVEYDFHNVFGHQILNATYHALLNIFPDKRPFIIGRSQLFGSAKWAGHWGGDNYSLWSYLYFSIPQALSYSLFGFPMFGVDTCGFAGDADMELCSRWMQLSAFFPFYRNHNTIGAASQEPYVWPEVISASKIAMKIRYALLPYIYTMFHLSHSTGSTTMRALAWDFPDEPWLAGADRQFLLGGAIMVTPCLVQGATVVDGVFPGVGSGTVWYDWYNQSAITGVSPGQNVTIDAPLGHIPVYIKGGNVLPMQEPALTVADVRNSSWSLLVALDGKGEATGGLYLDDGESLKPNATTWIDYSVSDGVLRATPKGDFKDPNALANVTIMGMKGHVSKVNFNSVELLRPASIWSLDTNDDVLRIIMLDSWTEHGAWDEEWTLSWE